MPPEPVTRYLISHTVTANSIWEKYPNSFSTLVTRSAATRPSPVFAHSNAVPATSSS